MVSSAYGPNECDWMLLTSTARDGYNKLVPGPGAEHDAFGFDPLRGTTQGSKHGPSVFKAYYDWFLCMHAVHGLDPAVFRGRNGRLDHSLVNALCDDSNFTHSTLQGAVHSLTDSSHFFAFMGGCMNLSKSPLTILEWLLGSTRG